MTVLQLSFITFGTAVVTAALCWAVAQAVFLPDAVTGRSNHTRPTSRAGGLVILGVVGAVLALSIFRDIFPVPPVAILGAVFAGLVGALDDAVGVNTVLKLIILAGLALALAVFSGPTLTVPMPVVESVTLQGVLAYAVKAFFVLGFINALNFMDGLNGIVAGMTTVCLAALIFVMGDAGAGWFGPTLVLGATLFGFAAVNILSGRIFLGDAGSLALGTFLATLALWPGQGDRDPLMLFLIGTVPILADTGLTLVRRGFQGKPILQPHKEHPYQKLRAAGYSHQAVALSYTALTAGSFACALIIVGDSEAAYRYLIAAVSAVALYAAVLSLLFSRAPSRRPRDGT